MPKIRHSYSENLLKLHKEANYPIVKSNRIVQNAHFSMKLVDQKVLASIIRTIKPGQKSLTVTFSAKKFADMLGIKKTPSRLRYIMNAIQRVYNDSFWVKLSDGKYHIWSWLEDVTIDPHNKDDRALCTVTFKPYLRKYLFSKSMKYHTIYEFSEIMLMKNRYAPRLYEIFRSNMSRQKNSMLGLNYSLNELRYDLNLMKRTKSGLRSIKRDKQGNIKYKYARTSNFMRRVIKPAVREMNRLTRYNVRIVIVRGRHGKAESLNVQMSLKNDRQLKKRGDLIFFITNHVPKKFRPHWKKMVINGKYSPIKNDNGFGKANHLIMKHGRYLTYDSLSGQYVWANKQQAQSLMRINRLQDKSK